jgi:hypothetical protein
LRTEFGAELKNPAGCFLFDLAELRKQLGPDADLDPFIEKVQTKKEEEQAQSAWSDDLPTE